MGNQNGEICHCNALGGLAHTHDADGIHVAKEKRQSEKSDFDKSERVSN